MKAFLVDSYGRGETVRLGDVPSPRMGTHDVLVRVQAAGVNPLDSKILQGEFRQILPYSTPFVLGHDVAGVVERAGSGVTRFSVGDSVYGKVDKDRIGTFAELVAVSEDDLAALPSTTSVAEAASLPMAALTAWQVLVEKADVRPGQRVLIHAGSGGVGTIAIQLAKHLGAHVATTASAANAPWLRELGADVVVDYRSEDFTRVLHDYDVVLDSQGPDHVLRSLEVVRAGGRVFGIGGPPDPDFARELDRRLLVPVMAVLSRKVRAAARRRGAHYSFHFMRADGSQLQRITELVDAGVIRPVLQDTFPFEDTAAALAQVAGGRVKGKVVITMV